jgi:hypothetical protein
MLRTNEYPTLDGIPATQAVRITRDGVELAVVANPDTAFHWILKSVPYSVSHALKHEGYRCEPVGTPA